MFAYLDNAATTRIDPKVLAAMRPWLEEDFANPSAVHSMGVKARCAIEEAREQIQKAVKRRGRVVFTGSGTEANNLAVFGFSDRNGDLLVASAVEHPSIKKPLAALAERRSCQAILAPVQRDGRLDLHCLSEILTEKTLLVALMSVQNEIGSIQPIMEAARIVRSKAPRAHFHVDAIQALGKLDLSGIAAAADSLSLSSHKIHGPKGVGALVVFATRPIKPQILGGGQESGARSGTENVPGIVGFAEATRIADSSLGATKDHLRRLRTALEAAIRAIPDSLFLPLERAAGLKSDAIVTCAFRGVRGETLQHALESRGVVVGTGSACNAAKSALSPTYEAMDLPEYASRGAIRISLSRLTTEDEVALLARELPPTLEKLRAE